jgi:hypothetical protein
LVNLAVTPNDWGIAAPTTNTMTMYVDYIHVWQSANPITSITPSTIPSTIALPSPTPTVTVTATATPTPKPTSTPIPTQTPTPAPARVTVTNLLETGTSQTTAAKVNYTIQTTSQLNVSYLSVAVRGQNGQQYDFTGQGPITLTGTQSFSSSKKFPKGTYTYWVYYLVNGQFVNLAPTKTFTIK